MIYQRKQIRLYPDNDVWYDILDDYALIEASFLEQYGIRLCETEMSWREFMDLLSCISADTPLGRIVAIRSEDDAEVLKHFNKSQNEIRNEWRRKQREENGELAEEEYRQSMDKMLAMLLA